MASTCCSSAPAARTRRSGRTPAARWTSLSVNVTLDDEAANQLPDSAQITTGSWRPADYEPTDFFPARTGALGERQPVGLRRSVGERHLAPVGGQRRSGRSGSIQSWSLSLTTSGGPPATTTATATAATTASPPPPPHRHRHRHRLRRRHRLRLHRRHRLRHLPPPPPPRPGMPRSARHRPEARRRCPNGFAAATARSAGSAASGRGGRCGASRPPQSPRAGRCPAPGLPGQAVVGRR